MIGVHLQISVTPSCALSYNATSENIFYTYQMSRHTPYLTIFPIEDIDMPQP